MKAMVMTAPGAPEVLQLHEVPTPALKERLINSLKILPAMKKV